MMFERRNMVVRRRFGEYEEEEVLAPRSSDHLVVFLRLAPHYRTTLTLTYKKIKQYKGDRASVLECCGPIVTEEQSGCD
jgi:hypothetical protein